MLIFIGICAFWDLKKEELPVVLLGAGFSSGWIISTLAGGLRLYEIALGSLLGGAVVVISLLSGKAIGPGDGLALAATGAYLGIYGNILLFLISLGISAVFAAVMLVRKKGRKERFPFMPFMLGGYIVYLLLGGV